MANNETQKRFGYQWTHFCDILPEFERHFQRLIYPLAPAHFAGKIVLDAGCGYGRYALCAAKYGAQVIGMDFSEAIYAANVVRHDANIYLVRGDILKSPFQEATFDIVMSIGVLHHLPDPFGGFRKLVKLVKPGGIMVIWLYNAERRLSNFFLDKLRRVVRPLPNNLLYALAYTLAIPDFILAKSLKVVTRYWLRNFTPTHFRLYGEFPFRVSWADWFDRLGAPIRHYYTKPELDSWIDHIDVDGDVYPTEDFGWSIIVKVHTNRANANPNGNN